jgi:hypothetical protein
MKWRGFRRALMDKSLRLLPAILAVVLCGFEISLALSSRGSPDPGWAIAMGVTLVIGSLLLVGSSALAFVVRLLLRKRAATSLHGWRVAGEMAGIGLAGVAACFVCAFTAMRS